MDLQLLWFVIIAVLWTGFFVLEGFDFGVGMLHILGRDDTERRVAINSVGPFWDGNEVWLIVAGAGLFAAFPGWYATMFSALYLALVLVLLALILRGTSFEYRGKGRSQRWRTTWSWALAVSSLLIPLLIGVGLGDLLAGLPIDDQQEFTGTFWNLLTPYGLMTGVTLTALCLSHGATFLGLKTDGPVRERSRKLAPRLAVASTVLAVAWVAWTRTFSGSAFALALQILLVLAAVAAVLWSRRGSEGQAFAATCVATGAAAASIFASLYPNVMVSTTGANLTIANTASGDYALGVMSVVALVLFPVVLLYQGWSYIVFRQRVSGGAQPADAGRPSQG